MMTCQSQITRATFPAITLQPELQENRTCRGQIAPYRRDCLTNGIFNFSGHFWKR